MPPLQINVLDVTFEDVLLQNPVPSVIAVPNVVTTSSATRLSSTIPCTTMFCPSYTGRTLQYVAFAGGSKFGKAIAQVSVGSGNVGTVSWEPGSSFLGTNVVTAYLYDGIFNAIGLPYSTPQNARTAVTVKSAGGTPAPSATPTPHGSASPGASPTPTAIPTATPTPIGIWTATPSPSPTPSPTPVPPPTATPTPNQSPGQVTEFALPAPGYPWGITTGRDGALWFTAGSALSPSFVGRVTTSGQFTESFLNADETQPWGIVNGPDGNIWFTEVSTNRIARFFVATGAIEEFSVPTPTSYPYPLAVGPDGNLWFIECRTGNNKVGRMTLNGQFTEWPVNAGIGGNPEQIVAGPDGAMWFTESDASKLGRITTGGVYSEVVLPTGSVAAGLTVGQDGALWFTGSASNAIGRVTTAGHFTSYPVYPVSGRLQQIAAGPDGTLWFTVSGSMLDQITTTGQITIYSAPEASAPGAITVGPDGAMWFDDDDGSTKAIGRVSTSVSHTATSIRQRVQHHNRATSAAH
jgi:virginiamycin B lyase